MSDVTFHKPPAPVSVRRVPVFLVFGAITATIAQFINGSVLGIAGAAGASGWWFAATAAVILSPAIEEAARMQSMIIMADQPGHARRDQYRWPIVAYGFGFGLTESIPRWIAAASLDPPSVVMFIAPALPLIMHVGLSIAAALYVSMGRPLSGLAFCATFHAVHNAYAITLIDKIPQEFVSAILLVQCVAYALICLALLMFWKSKAPALQFRCSVAADPLH